MTMQTVCATTPPRPSARRGRPLREIGKRRRVAGNRWTQANAGPAGTSIRRVGGAQGKVSVGHGSNAGGLAGRNLGTIADSRAAGAVKAGDFSSVDGLVGINEGGNITGSMASADVEGGMQSNVGGLVGSNDGIITASPSSGTVSGGRYARLGGLVGRRFRPSLRFVDHQPRRREGWL
ncbi:hypothetical protein [Burkholderia territorii]|uniref:hypothetical protein n=1 Tax=Burkholderia territorii TaxID=1503055 RepID=UPI0012D99C3A|nr:hypothetical protein [Burkholderia territorii]